MKMSQKQADYWHEGYHRWAIKCGATRSGKTYLDYYIIPRRIREMQDKEGAIVLMGNTRGTLQRNIIDPMQQMYTDKLISSIHSDNTVDIFGCKAYCLGADNAKHVDRVRGMSIKYCYGDEVVTWHEDVFNMLKSRLDKPYSRFEGTCNPDSPTHWLKQFIDTDADIFYQHYTIFDNPFLDKTVRDEMVKEHQGVWKQRNIYGLWVRAEGVIYQAFADDTERYLIDKLDEQLEVITIGIDYGASQASSAFKAIGISKGYQTVYVLDEYDTDGVKEPEQLYQHFETFYSRVCAKFGRPAYAFCDYGALGQVITAGLYTYCRRKGIAIQVQDCIKGTILDRIAMIAKLQAQDRFKVMRSCKKMIKALQEAVWDEKHEDTRLDDGTTDIDSLDAMEYAVFPFYEKLIKAKQR